MKCRKARDHADDEETELTGYSFLAAHARTVPGVIARINPYKSGRASRLELPPVHPSRQIGCGITLRSLNLHLLNLKVRISFSQWLQVRQIHQLHPEGS